MSAPSKKPPEGDTEEGAEGAPVKKKMSGKTLILFVVLPALLVVGGGGAAAYFLLFNKKPAEAHGTEEAGAEGEDAGGHGKTDKKKEKKKKEGGHGGGGAAAADALVVNEGPDGVVFVELPQIIVNIQTEGGSGGFLKLKLTIETKDHDLAELLQPEMPRLTDTLNVFLRELRPEDLAGSAGSYRLRMELLRRVNMVIAPSHADAVLIEEMLLQ